MNANTPFIGQIFCVTRRSVYCISVVDMMVSPTLMKVTKRDSDPGGRRVAAYVRDKFYLAITLAGIRRYSTASHQRLPAGGDKLPHIVTVPKRLRGLGTGPIVGLFADRRTADECFVSSAEAPVLDGRWTSDTKAVLALIGADHPLISVSVDIQDLFLDIFAKPAVSPSPP